MADGTTIPGFTRTVTAPGGAPAVEAKPTPGANDGAAHPANAAAAPAAPAGAEGATAAAEAGAAAAESDPKLAPRLAHIRRAEQSLVAKQRQWQQQWQKQEAEIKTQRDEVAAARKEIEDFRKERDALRANPTAWLEKGGFKYDDLTKQILADGEVDPRTLIQSESQALREEIKRIREENEQRVESERKARETWTQDQQRQQAESNRQLITKFHNDTVAFAKANAEKYPLVNALSRQDEVPGVIDAYYKQTFNEDIPKAQAEGRAPYGRILTADEAAERVEAYYRDQFSAAEKVMAARKLAAAGAGAAPAPADASAPIVQHDSHGQRPTVSNAVVATPAARAKAPILSLEERMQRARDAMDAVAARARAAAGGS